MKKHFLNALLLLCATLALAQTPQAVCYQAAAKDANGLDLINQGISIQATIIQNGPNGTVQWQERHSTFTDQFGLFTINIGQGNYVGGAQTDFIDIDWGTGTYWLRIEMDASGGQNFLLMGSTQMLSVPYALYTEKSNQSNHSVTSDYADAAGMAETLMGDNDLDVTNELQELVIQNGTLVLQNPDGTTSGAGVEFPEDGDTSSINELQNLVAISGELFLENPDGSLSADGLGFDDSPTNELQDLVVQNGTLFLESPDGTITGSGYEIPYDADTSATNELQELVIEDGTLSITGGNQVDLESLMPLGGFGSSSDFPLGIVGEHIVLTEGEYQVPGGKILWITAGGPIIKILNLGLPSDYEHPTTPNMPVLDENNFVEDCMCSGILIDTASAVEPIILNFITDISVYEVPENKVLFIKSGLKNDQVGALKVNGVEMEFLRPSFTRGTRIISFPENTNIQAIENAFGEIDIVLTGYVLDKSALSFDPNDN